MFSDPKHNVDCDWIDIKANNYFNNDEYQANKKVTSSKKPEWQNVYSKDNIAPEEGADNAFQFKDLWNMTNEIENKRDPSFIIFNTNIECDWL